MTTTQPPAAAPTVADETVENITLAIDMYASNAARTRTVDGYDRYRDQALAMVSALAARAAAMQAAIEEAVDELSRDHGDLWPNAGWHVQQRLEAVLPLASEAQS